MTYFYRMIDSRISIINKIIIISPKKRNLGEVRIDIDKIKTIKMHKDSLKGPEPYYEIILDNKEKFFITFASTWGSSTKNLHKQFKEVLNQKLGISIKQGIDRTGPPAFSFKMAPRTSLKEEKPSLFFAEKHGRYSVQRPPKGLKDSFIKISKENLTIAIKISGERIRVPLINIDVAERIDSSKTSYVGTALFGTPPVQQRKIYTKIITKTGQSFYVTFISGMSGWQVELHDEFYAILRSQLDRIQKEKELEELKKMQKPTNVFYINIPPQTKLSALTALKCPSCQAPLEYMPPCKCEHCGVMIELMK